MARVPAELREHILAFWRGHSEAWKLSRLTQREYCERHNISLKSFGNWRAQLKRIAVAGWATVCSLITTAKLNGVEPYAYLKDVLERMAAGHPMSQLDQLLPWNWTSKSAVNH